MLLFAGVFGEDLAASRLALGRVRPSVSSRFSNPVLPEPELPPIVVKDQFSSEAIELPARSFTPVDTVTLYEVDGLNALGVKIAVLSSALTDTIPETTLISDALLTIKVEELTVDFWTGSMNDASIAEVIGTLVVPSFGFTLPIAGGTMSLFFFLIELSL